MSGGLSVLYPAGWDILNQGTVQGSTFGVYLSNGGTVTNQSGGAIGGAYGIYGGPNGALTVVNAGSIAGTTDAVKFASGFANRLIFDPNAVFQGSVDGGNTIGATAVSTLELASGTSTGSITGIGTQFIDFARIKVDAGASWVLNGTDTIRSGATVTNAGTLGGGVTLAGGNLSNTATGTVTAPPGYTTVSGLTGAPATVVNAGLILSSGYGKAINLQGGGSVLNQTGGTITGTGGIYGGAFATVTVVNAGTIAATGYYGYGLILSGGGIITNQSGAIISAHATAVDAAGSPLTVVNAGHIESLDPAFVFGVYSSAGGSVTNQAGGTISGYRALGGGIQALTVMNAGLIAGSNVRGGKGVALFAGGIINNQADATISGYGGIYGGIGNGGDSAVTIVNAGTISAAFYGYGILLHDGGNITNQSGGSISAYVTAIDNVGGAALTVVNDGLIAARASYFVFGLYDLMGGIVTNRGDGTISGYRAIGAAGEALTVVNAGMIIGANVADGLGVGLYAGGILTNQAGGTISGYTGIKGSNGLSGGALTVVNAGSIIGFGTQGYSVRFAAGHANLLVIDPGAVFAGAVTGGNAVGATSTSTLELASGASIGALSGLLTQFTDFALVTVDKAAVWTFGATDTIGSGVTLANAGTLTGGVTLAPRGVLSNTSTGTITATGSAVYGLSGGMLTVVNAGKIAGTTDAVAFAAGSGNRLVIDPGAVFTGTVDGGNAIGGSAASTLELASGASAGTLSGIGAQFIDFADIEVDTGASWSLAGTNTLAVGTTVTNLGILTGNGTLTNGGMLSGGLALAAGAVLTNVATGTVVASGGAAVDGLTGAAAIIVNAGTVTNVSNASGQGVHLAAGGRITNLSGGSISGYTGIQGGEHGTLTVVNAGSIGGVTNAVSFSAGYTDRLIIAPNALFAGSVDGGNSIGATAITTLELASGASAGTLSGLGNQFTHFARIAVDAGAQWTLTGANVIAAGETITNAGALTDAGALINAGTVTGGLRLAAGVTLSNASTGKISASSGSALYGVAGGAATVVNAGTIAGAGNAIAFTTGYANRLIIDPNAAFSGTVDGGNTVGSSAVSTLELASGASAGTLSAIGSQFIGFGQTTIDAGGSWSLTGTNALASGTTLTNAGTLTLQDTLSGSATVINDGVVLIGSARVTVASLTGTGVAVMGGGANLEILGSVTAGDVIAFNSSDSVLTFDPTQFAGLIRDFTAGNMINLTGVDDASSAGIVNGNTLEIQRTHHASIDLTLSSDAASTGNVFFVSSGPAVLTDNPACFLRGTLIRTDHGEVPVEALSAGDQVITLSGAARPVHWIGYRTIDLTRHPAPHRVKPIRIRANAFADGQPCRDLLLSPDHAVLRDGVLVPVRLLVNGGSILRDGGHRRITYYHVELETHDILLTENLAAESYLETGNRGLFENGGDPLVLHPGLTNGQVRRVTESCRPFADDPATVEPIWRSLAIRSEQLGQTNTPPPEITSDAGLQLVADGHPLSPVSVEGGKHVFVVPPGAKTLRLRSRSAAPSETAAWVSDDRQLGVQLGGLIVRSGADVITIPLDHPAFGAGWWQDDRAEWYNATALRRWTDGDALVPMPEAFAPGPCLLEVQVAATVPYPLSKELQKQPSLRRSA